MAVAVEMRFKAATVEQYDQVMEKMELAGGDRMPEHGISHWVAQVDGGLKVVDVWESREDFDRFAQEQIGPYTQEVGIEGPPEITVYEVHNYLVR